jgi:tRNA pseudouridine38-40 synthase
MLPKSIRVLEAKWLETPFHPTLDAKSKIYQYKIVQSNLLCPFKRKTSWHVPRELNINAITEAITILIGTKDFKGLSNTSDKSNTIRSINSIKVEQNENCIYFFIEGDNFLYKMVRNIIGSLVHVGLSSMSIDNLKEAIERKQRSLAGPCAPARGLYLNEVLYDDSVNLLLKKGASC